MTDTAPTSAAADEPVTGDTITPGVSTGGAPMPIPGVPQGDPSLTDTNFRAPALHADPTTTDSPPKIPNVDDSGTVLGSVEALARAEEAVAEIEALVAEEQALGYRGHNPDPIPNEAYTMAGVLGDGPKPTLQDPPPPVALQDNPHDAADAPAEAPPA